MEAEQKVKNKKVLIAIFWTSFNRKKQLFIIKLSHFYNNIKGDKNFLLPESATFYRLFWLWAGKKRCAVEPEPFRAHREFHPEIPATGSRLWGG